MIFIEGPDNSGKSTLCKKLEKAGVKLGDIGNDVSKNLINFSARTQLDSRNMVFDRSRVISELVYGNVIRNDCRISKESVEQFIYARPLVIYCRPPTSRILRNNGREQMEGVLEKHEQLIHTYDHVMDSLKAYGVRVIDFDYTQPNHYPLVEKEIKKKLQRQFEVKCAAISLRDNLLSGIVKRDMKSTTQKQRERNW